MNIRCWYQQILWLCVSSLAGGRVCANTLLHLLECLH